MPTCAYIYIYIYEMEDNTQPSFFSRSVLFKGVLSFFLFTLFFVCLFSPTSVRVKGIWARNPSLFSLTEVSCVLTYCWRPDWWEELRSVAAWTAGLGKNSSLVKTGRLPPGRGHIDICRQKRRKKNDSWKEKKTEKSREKEYRYRQRIQQRNPMESWYRGDCYRE